MKTVVLFITLFTSTLMSLTAQNLTLVSEKAIIEFNYVSEKVTGSIAGIKATIQFDVNNLSKSSISGTADVKTLSTGIKKRDHHLYSSDYFNVDKYPVMSFRSTSIEKIEAGYKMKGIMNISGNENQIEFTFSFINQTFEGNGTIYMNDFKVMTKKEREKSMVLLKVVFPVN
jgi:polyisoprenoid-binding protein YceI